MVTCKVNNNFVDCSLVGVDCHAFGRALADDYAIPYSLTISLGEVLSRFGSYYQDFIDRESEDEGFQEELRGWALLLKETGYLSLDAMISTQPSLLAKLLLEEMPNEFMGYIFLDNRTALSKKYILQTLVSVKVTTSDIICTGMAFINHSYKNPETQ